MEEISKDTCLSILYKLQRRACTPKEYSYLENAISRYFSMIEHMRKTHLYDVYMYEEKLAKGALETVEILVHDNTQLKKEVNRLRKELGKIEKYKEE